MIRLGKVSVTVIVDARTCIGDWEVVGKGHKGGFATLAECKSRLYLALPIANKTAQNANDAINKLLTPLKLSHSHYPKPFA
jgi:IS30 family transposase